MSKRIIFCADGTWDDPLSASNVYKIFKAIPVTPDQFPSYDDGVGADGNPLQKLAGGAIGDGIFQKIKDGYTKIAQLYDADDALFIFGFSRGAYTARSLAGMIAICGLPTGKFDANLVEVAFQAYRNPSQRQALLASLSAYNLYDAKLTMVGVWDTVGALGIPAIVGGVDPALYSFLDTGLHPDVLNAFQALAIDERRVQFPPTLWTPPFGLTQTVRQIWFAGVHCDVGGGYPQTGLSDITLSWMMSNAAALGLQFDPTVVSQYTPIDPNDAAAPAHESWNPFWLIPITRRIAPNASISDSVVLRCQSQGNYRPSNLTFTGGTLANTYQVVPVV